MVGIDGGIGEEEEISEMMRKPAWLEGLLGETFFAVCGSHLNHRKNEKNIFCLDCCLSFCPHCLPSHTAHHPLLQIRRYVYHDVVRLVDLQKLIDCSYIQPYTINGAKVIFLKQRPQSRLQASRLWKGPPNVCLSCERILQDPFHFCSLSCKVDDSMRRGLNLAWVTSATQIEAGQLGMRMMIEEEEDDDDVDDGNTHTHTQHDDHHEQQRQQFTHMGMMDDIHHYHHHHHHQEAGVAGEVGVGSSSRTTGDQMMKTTTRKKTMRMSTTSSSSSSENPGGGGGSKAATKAGFLTSVFSFSSRRKGPPHRSPLS